MNDRQRFVGLRCFAENPTSKKIATTICPAQHSHVNIEWDALCELTAAEIKATIGQLPKPLREQAEKLPVTLEMVPSAELQGDGITPDTLGMFTGAELSDDAGSIMPPQIILFLNNLWDFSGCDRVAFREEVRTTLLHELGHFLGLNEDDLTDRGLE